MKGIILAGGRGTRLWPMTRTINKHLLAVYDKPMIYYSISSLLLAGIRDILIISHKEYIQDFQALLGDGYQWGVNIEYAIQDEPKGIAEAFIVGENFIGNDTVCLLLGDNIFQGSGLEDKLVRAKSLKEGGEVFAYYVKYPQQYGVVSLDAEMKPTELVEKPKDPKSNYAVTGIYFYDNNVIECAKQLKPSARGELEITDINKHYLSQKQLKVTILGRGITWLDMGTPENLLHAANYVQVIENRQGLKIGCPEEISWRKGFISSEELEEQMNNYKGTDYFNYLKKVLETHV